MSDEEKFGPQESVKLNGRYLQYGVLFDPNTNGYQIYLYPGMTVAEIAFDVMVTIRLLIKDGYIKNKKEFDDLVKKYITDPQYRPLSELEPTHDEVN